VSTKLYTQLVIANIVCRRIRANEQVCRVVVLRQLNSVNVLLQAQHRNRHQIPLQNRRRNQHRHQPLNQHQLQRRRQLQNQLQRRLRSRRRRQERRVETIPRVNHALICCCAATPRVNATGAATTSWAKAFARRPTTVCTRVRRCLAAKCVRLRNARRWRLRQCLLICRKSQHHQTQAPATTTARWILRQHRPRHLAQPVTRTRTAINAATQR